MEIFDEFLCPFWDKNTNHSFKEWDPSYECDENGPVAWPDIEEENMSNTNHDSKKSWKNEHTFILRELHYCADIVSFEKHRDAHNHKHETPELCEK